MWVLYVLNTKSAWHLRLLWCLVKGVNWSSFVVSGWMSCAQVERNTAICMSSIVVRPVVGHVSICKKLLKLVIIHTSDSDGTKSLDNCLIANGNGWITIVNSYLVSDTVSSIMLLYPLKALVKYQMLLYCQWTTCKLKRTPSPNLPVASAVQRYSTKLLWDFYSMHWTAEQKIHCERVSVTCSASCVPCPGSWLP